MSVREADFAGSWYPESESRCLRMFEQFERSAKTVPDPGGPLRGGIVPHAGWVFSGGIAYNVIREVARAASGGDTVLLFGGHLHPSSSLSVMTRGDFWTPLGPIPTDEELAARLASGPGVQQVDPERHAPDNTVELQAPLIKHLLPDATLVVIGAPPRSETLAFARTAAEQADRLGRKIVAIGSTDLSHYGPNYGWAPEGHGPAAEAWVREENDPRFIEKVCQLDAQGAIDEGLRSSNACCPGAAAAAIEVARAQGATTGHLLTYATSADIRPDTSFVGYAGIVF
jgi:AmmeMemoRadiSam system protein B